MRIIITPRWSGHADDDWYPWISRALRGHELSLARLRPNPSAPTIEACVEELRQRVGDDPGELRRTFLVGHSVGCQATLRLLATLPPGHAVAGVLCVAGWWAVDRPWDTIRPWMDSPLDLQRVRAAAGRVTVLLSDDDPYTADAGANGATWEARLGARVVVERGGRHFNGKQEPAVLRVLQEALAEVGEEPPLA